VRLDVSIDIAAPRQAVWEVLTDWERQPEWMLDAQSVEVLTPVREGVGVTLRCPTNVLGVTVEDVMRVTGWDEPARLEVLHLGRVITGSGAFELTETGPDRTRIDWWEEVDPPFGALGEWGASVFVRPILGRLFSRSLRRLAELVEPSAAPG
jgi:carbon monoxide dehydrogenase subunit G